MNPININISGEPVPFRTMGQGRLQKELKEKAKLQHTGDVLKGPLCMDIIFHFTPPKRFFHLVEEGYVFYHIGKKDQTDSLVHFACKYLHHVAFSNPNQVVELRTKKIYSLNPRTEIQVYKM